MNKQIYYTSILGPVELKGGGAVSIPFSVNDITDSSDLYIIQVNIVHRALEHERTQCGKVDRKDAFRVNCEYVGL